MSEFTKQVQDTSQSEIKSGEVTDLSNKMQKKEEQHNQRDCWYPGYDSMQGSDYIVDETGDETTKTDVRQQSRQESMGNLNTEGDCWSGSYSQHGRGTNTPNDTWDIQEGNVPNDAFELSDHANKTDIQDHLECNETNVHVIDNQSEVEFMAEPEQGSDDNKQGECIVNDQATNKAEAPVSVPFQTPCDKETMTVKKYGRETDHPVSVPKETLCEHIMKLENGRKTDESVSVPSDNPSDLDIIGMKHGREKPSTMHKDQNFTVKDKTRKDVEDKDTIKTATNAMDETTGENAEDILSGKTVNTEDLDVYGETITPTECPRHSPMTWLIWLILASMFCVMFLIPTFYRIANGCAIILEYLKLIYSAVLTQSNFAIGLQCLSLFCCSFKMHLTFKSRHFVCIFGLDKSSDLEKADYNNATKISRGTLIPNWIFNFRGFKTSGDICTYPVSAPWTTTNGYPVCACTEDQDTMENPLRDSSLDYNSIEEDDLNLPGNEASSPLGFLPASNEESSEEEHQTEQNVIIGDSGYAASSQPLSSQRSYSTPSRSSGNLLISIGFGNVMEDPNHPSTLIAQPDTLREMQMQQGALFLFSIIHNVRYGTNDELLANVSSQRSGGIITDQTFAGYIENNKFEENIQYGAIEEQRHSTLCKVLRNGYKFLSKTIPRRILNVDMLRRYLRASQVNPFVPRIIGVLFNTSDIKILFQFRSGYTLAEMMRGGRFIKGLDLARFIWYLVDSVQKLHREDIALLSINPFTISLDEEYNLATIQFTNIQLTNTAEQLIVDYPSYAPIGRIDTVNTGDRKSFDMYSLGVLCHCLLNKGEELWHGLNPAEIAEHADDIYKRVVSLDQRQHIVVPYVVHLALCLLHPNANARPTAETVFQHVFFKDEVHALTALRRVNTHGHGYPYWMVTITDGFRLLHVTTTEDGTALYELLSDLRLRDMIGQATAQAWYTGMRQRCAITIHSDLMLEVRIRN